MKLLKVTSQSIKEAALIIQKGGLVAFPTETVYGLGVDALNPLAVARVFEAKERPNFDPLIVHISALTDIEWLCLKIDKTARTLMEHFWPGPLTLVLPKSSLVPDIVTAGLPTVAVRMPSHPVAAELIKAAGTPVAAPSANLFSRLSPTTAQHVKEQLGDKIDLILDGGQSNIGLESTVILLAFGKAHLLRPGGLSLEDIENVIGAVKTQIPKSLKPLSPGQLPRHYSPRTPIRLLPPDKIEFEEGKKVGLLVFTPLKAKMPCEVVEILSPDGDIVEAAANLFPCLHRLDKVGLDIIYAEPVPEIGLGRAIMDRLYKAAGDVRSR
jgi:L-threonylcarbamoyladenylate synthase